MLVAQVTKPEDQPYIDAARALTRAGFHFPNDPDNAYQTYGLSLAQVDVLIALTATPEATLTCSEIAEKTLGGITGVLDKLEARGLVKRTPSRDDRRSILVRLTPKGVEFFRKFYPELVRDKRALVEKAFGPEQMKEFSKLLEGIFLASRTTRCGGPLLGRRSMRLYIFTIAFLASLTLAACSDPYNYSKTAKGALIGGAVGADAGALVGAASGAPIEGAVVGAGAGALGGTAIGAALDAKDARRERSDRFWHLQWSHQHEFKAEEAEEAEDAEYDGRHDRGKHLGWYKHHKHHGDEDDQGEDD